MLSNIPKFVYSGISFRKGETPELSILKEAFLPEGLFINNKGETPIVKGVKEYIDMVSKNIEAGNILSINEVEESQEILVFGKVAQISSKYTLTFEGSTHSQTRYGVNLFQLILKNDTWFVASMCWDDKTDKSLW